MLVWEYGDRSNILRSATRVQPQVTVAWALGLTRGHYAAARRPPQVAGAAGKFVRDVLPRRPATLTLGRLGTAPLKKPASEDAGFFNGA